MSDDIFEIHTSFADVASLGQGWVERVDARSILLPLAGSVAPGDGVRFIVHLSDGTPAFAGAGRCADVGDRGDDAPEDERYETLLDTLQFDERSRPVFEYLVAVRASRGIQAAPSVEKFAPRAAVGAGGGSFAAALEGHTGSAPPVSETLDTSAGRTTQAGGGTGSLGRPSMIPTGMLRRPARGLEWEPAAPRMSMPNAASGLFQYDGGGIPRPAKPPYPDLPRSLWVTPAPRPGDPVPTHPARAESTAQDFDDVEDEAVLDDLESDS